MASVSVNAPKTPVTDGSDGIAQATVPNVCKMPGPPAPFVPTPLPNIGQSGKDPQGYSTTVKIEGHAVAIKGASFGSSGDVASKGTGGGLVSSNVEGPTKFVGPGSLDVQIEGKAVQLLGDPMMNNCGPSGSPPNAATMMGLAQASGSKVAPVADPCKGVNCAKVEKKIANIKKEIQKRTGELHEDPQSLPWDLPGNPAPSLTRKGHVKLLNKHKENLAKQKGLHCACCGGQWDAL
jgi:uncharacterized Zn-binding protein involved in type VI secretion